MSLPLAVLFCHNNYDGSSAEKTISATSIMKPIRSIILAMQNQNIQAEADIVDLIPSVFGSAIHAFAELAWKDKETTLRALKALNIPQDTINKIKINPTTANPDDIPIYVERRSIKEINGWTIRGKFDMCVNGKLADYKTTSVWGTIFKSNDEDYKIQGSIYRWLNQDIVIIPEISIEKIYTDWKKSDALRDSNYPQLRAESFTIPLMRISETETYITSRLELIDRYAESSQEELPLCTDDELWSTAAKWKYFKKAGAKRATKVYTDQTEANTRLTTEGTGEVIYFPGQVKRCTYCNVKEICAQAQQLINKGRLEP